MVLHVIFHVVYMLFVICDTQAFIHYRLYREAIEFEGLLSSARYGTNGWAESQHLFDGIIDEGTILLQQLELIRIRQKQSYAVTKHVFEIVGC